MIDKDLITGRKRILGLLHLAKWEAVKKRIDEEGLPAVKVCGRWEMSMKAYRAWRENLVVRKYL
ncbi:MAG TPA: hypothetical protein ENO00_02080 [Deltaproteobacteria bacterium]|nr:hypothetical protein [Deltaproteobacteria bacterium]